MHAINKLLSIMATLRDPLKGCEWDRAQTIASIAPYSLQEVYELLEAIESDDMDGLCDELGDLLFHIVFYAEMANEAGHFDFTDIVERACAKLQRRHPLLFSPESDTDAVQSPASWEGIKQQEREEKARQNGSRHHLLADITTAQPAMIRADKLQRRAASVGFDWADTGPVVAKLEEELNELKNELGKTDNQGKISAELGDLLFACINLGRHLGIDAEAALRNTNRKFVSRFNFIETQLEDAGRNLKDSNLLDMEVLWQQAKQFEQD